MIDPILSSVFARAFKSITDEMSISLQRTTRSPILCEAKDFVTGLYDAEGRMLEQTENLPILSFSLGVSILRYRSEAGANPLIDVAMMKRMSVFMTVHSHVVSPHFSPGFVARRFKGAVWLAFTTESRAGVVDTTLSSPTEGTPDRACHCAVAVEAW